VSVSEPRALVPLRRSHRSTLVFVRPSVPGATTITAKSCCDDRLNSRASVDALCYYRASVAVLSDLNACPSEQDRSIHEM
jgi:hypothetical protein